MKKIFKKKQEESEESKEEKKKDSGKKTKAEILQDTLGLEPGTLEDIEKKLFVARFIDYFSEEPLDFIHRDKDLNKYTEQISNIMEQYGEESEEDKLVNQSFENKKILKTINQIKTNTETIAAEKGFKKSINKKMRNWSIFVSLPMFALIIIVTILPYFGIEFEFLYLLPVLCIFCMVPTIIRNYLSKKWYNFKEQNKMNIYTENRDDIMVLKRFVGDILENIRSRLLEYKVPLELIKFALNSNDYEAIKILNQKMERGTQIYFVRFDYPSGVEPFPLPEELARQYREDSEPLEKMEEAERNFVVLEEIEAQDGIINTFVPALKDKGTIPDQINDMLNNCEFKKAERDLDLILPNYSKEMAIYCKCGETIEIKEVHVCNWKEEFKFYLFEGKECKCGEKIYALSLMDKEQEVPKDLKAIF
jgi:hypothetical protein